MDFNNTLYECHTIADLPTFVLFVIPEHH